MNLLVEIFY